MRLPHFSYFVVLSETNRIQLNRAKLFFVVIDIDQNTVHIEHSQTLNSFHLSAIQELKIISDKSQPTAADCLFIILEHDATC